MSLSGAGFTAGRGLEWSPMAAATQKGLIKGSFPSFPRLTKKSSCLPANVIKLSKSAHTKKCPPRKIEVGIFYAFVMWFACAYFAGRTMTCPS